MGRQPLQSVANFSSSGGGAASGRVLLVSVGLVTELHLMAARTVWRWRPEMALRWTSVSPPRWLVGRPELIWPVNDDAHMVPHWRDMTVWLRQIPRRDAATVVGVGKMMVGISLPRRRNCDSYLYGSELLSPLLCLTIRGGTKFMSAFGIMFD